MAAPSEGICSDFVSCKGMGNYLNAVESETAMRKYLRRNRSTIASVLVIAFILSVIYALTTNVYADAATAWAYVWGWGPRDCAKIGGTASWVWDSVLNRPNWLCRYPR